MLIINDVSHNTAETGRFATTTRGGTLTVTNGYNLRGWLTSIESTPFREYLYYEQPHNGSTAQYGGNISSMDWKTGDNILRGYTFQYDGLSRLTGAAYSENGSASTHYGTSYQYDLMGNITGLTRSGLQDDNSYGLIDNLSFDYNGNQLLKVTDAVTSGPNYSGAFHFNDHSDVSQEYEYDLNGNMTKDLNKKITSVEYNVLNLPEEVSINESSVGYSYAADGRKLAVHRPFKLSPLFPGLDHQFDSIAVPSPGGHGFVIIGDSSSLNPPVHDWLFPFHKPTYNGEHYCGSIIYSKNILSTILFDGGYVTFSGSSPVYHYYLQDHLGNNCVVANESGTVEQVNHYYPYGGLMGESTGGDVQRYKYNGKELDRMHGLDWYDYGARHYDAAIVSWPTMDPLSEKYYSISPYVYCLGNPMKYVDIDGRETGLPEEIIFALTHPFITIRVGIGVTNGSENISTNASRFSTRGNILYGSNPKAGQDDRGSENGAFRHALWQAEIASEFGTNIAKQIGNAHEDDPNIDMSQRFFSNLDDADKSVDLHNNIIGRSIGYKNKGAGMKNVAISVLNTFKDEGLYVAKEAQGGYILVKVKLDFTKYENLLNIFKQLDNNGRYDYEKPKPDNDKILRYEALQNALP